MTRKIDTKMLRDAAYDLGLTTYELAAQSGLSQPMVRSVLLGEKRPSCADLTLICDVLDLDLNDVFIDNGEKMATA